MATIAMPYCALGHLFGFVALPPLFLLCLAGILALYIFSAEMAKRWFYRRKI
jgi:Mg2+-importing ATPase